MKLIQFISPIKIKNYIPKEYYGWCGVSPYFSLFLNLFFHKRLKYSIKLILKILKNYRAKVINILDIGCGIGFTSLNLGFNIPNSKIIGIDILTNEQNQFVNQLFNKFSINFKIIIHDIQKKTNFKDRYFDLIIALDVLEHLKHPELALREIKRILKNKGKIIISVPIESKIINILRKLYSKVFKISNIDPGHWKGSISSVKKFDELIKKKNFRINFIKKYPFKFLPQIFSYDVFYVVSKI